MMDEVVRCLRPVPGDIAVDCTLGGGGHAQAILDAVLPGGRLIGLDVDAAELARTEARLRDANYGADTFVAQHGNFAALPRALATAGAAAADVILVDLGVSSMQIGNPARGFSYKDPGPLDMRMDPSQGEPACDLIARVSEEVLARLLTENSDEPHAAFIAGLLKQKRVTTTHEVERLIRMGLNRAFPDLSKADVKMSVRRTFQALRIAVNGELDQLGRALDAAHELLAPGGRLAVISFHSLEDRMVKQFIRDHARDCICPPKQPICTCDHRATLRDVVRGGRTASDGEVARNPRARSARLRAAERLAEAA
jgi:16S rRNA (cytosine1402-N4)-methyltransferase